MSKSKMADHFEGEENEVIVSAVRRVEAIPTGDMDAGLALIRANAQAMKAYLEGAARDGDAVDKSTIVFGHLINDLFFHLMVGTSIVTDAIAKLKADGRDTVIHNSVHNLVELISAAGVKAELDMGCRVKKLVGAPGDEGCTVH